MKDQARQAVTHRAAAKTERAQLPIERIIPDDRNRAIINDDDVQSLVESIRVLGILQPLHVQTLDESRYRLIDGERRWRAAQRAGLETVPCEIWRACLDGEAVVAGIILNEQRKAASCIHVARRLREIKNELGLSREQVAERVGLPLHRVKTYFALFAASDELLRLFDERDVPLKVAVELARYERATSEGRARKLAARYRDAPLTCHEIAALRKRHEKANTTTDDAARPPSSRPRLQGTLERLSRQLERDGDSTLAELGAWLRGIGYALVPLGGRIPRSEIDA
jgi:ParB family chromosome partitioning protein